MESLNSPQAISLPAKLLMGLVAVLGFLGILTQVPAPWSMSLMIRLVKRVWPTTISMPARLAKAVRKVEIPMVDRFCLS